MDRFEDFAPADSRLPAVFMHRRLSPKDRSSPFCNWHENVELLYILRGSGRVVIDAEAVDVSERDLVAVDSNRLHRVEYTDGLDYYVLHVDRSFCLANFFDTNGISFVRRIRDGRAAELVEEFARAYESGDGGDFRVPYMRELILRLMMILCREYRDPSSVPSESVSAFSHVKSAIGYLNSHFAEDISLQEVADHACLSKFYFAREFRRLTGYTFLAYLNHVRCENAKKMLEAGQSTVSEIAARCGFRTPSYFSRIFRKSEGVYPKDYRKAVRSGQTPPAL